MSLSQQQPPPGHGRPQIERLDREQARRFLRFLGRDTGPLVLTSFAGKVARFPCTGEAPAFDEAERFLLQNPAVDFGLIPGVPLPMPASWGTDIEHWGFDQRLPRDQQEGDRLKRFAAWLRGERHPWRAPKQWGASDAHISHCNAVPAECDAGTFDQQRAMIELAGLPPPSLEMGTGNKSLHFWWRLRDGEHLTPAEFRAVALGFVERITAAAAQLGIDPKADRANATPSHPMRMPGWKHRKTGAVAVIHYDNGPRCSREQLLALVPPEVEHQKAAATRTKRAARKGAPRLFTYAGTPNDDPTWLSLLPPADQRALAVWMLQQPNVPLRVVADQGVRYDCIKVLAGLVHHFGQWEAAAICRDAGWWSPIWDPDKEVGSITPRTTRRASMRLLILLSGAKPPETIAAEAAVLEARPGPIYEAQTAPASDKPLALAMVDGLLLQKPQVDATGKRLSPVAHGGDTCGIGKSHAVQSFARILQEARCPGARIIYVSPFYRSPSVKDLALWAAVESRHYGLVAGVVNGQAIIRRRNKEEVKSGAPLVEAPSCRLNYRIESWRAVGGNQENVRDMCLQCYYRSTCSYVEKSSDFDAKWKSGHTSRVRCSIASIPHLKTLITDDDWGKTFIVIDESGQLNDAQYETFFLPYDLLGRWADWLQRHDWQVDAEHRAPLQQLLHNLQALPSTFAGSEVKYGLDVEVMKTRFGEAAAALDGVCRVSAMLTLPPLDLAPEDEADFATDAPLLADSLLLALRGVEGAVSASTEGLTITRPSTAVVEALSSCGGVVILDATASTDELAAVLKREPEGMVVVRTGVDDGLAQVRFIQVRDFGAMGVQRGANQQGPRRQALLNLLRVKHWLARATRPLHGPQLPPDLDEWPTDTRTPEELDRPPWEGTGEALAGVVGVLDHGRFAQAGEGAWHRDSRGSNAFAESDALVCFGLPRPNLNAARAEFAVTNPGNPIDGEAFDQWYRRWIGRELMQGIHRLRPLRRPGEVVTVYLICEDDLSEMGLNVEQLASHAIGWGAGSKEWQTLAAAAEAVRDLSVAREVNRQGRVSRWLVAARAGVSEQTLKRALQLLDGDWGDFCRRVMGEA